MNQGDIIIMNFPFSSLKKSKIRPALVISNRTFNKDKDLILMAISSKKSLPKYSITLKQNHVSSGRLLKSS